jgi:hypothetical protein
MRETWDEGLPESRIVPNRPLYGGADDGADGDGMYANRQVE